MRRGAIDGQDLWGWTDRRRAAGQLVGRRASAGRDLVAVCGSQAIAHPTIRYAATLIANGYGEIRSAGQTSTRQA
jgi:hypothetical protein